MTKKVRIKSGIENEEHFPNERNWLFKTGSNSLFNSVQWAEISYLGPQFLYMELTRKLDSFRTSNQKP